MFILTPRWFFAATAIVCAGLLGFGYYLQFHQGLEPCPMCIFQRLCYMGVVAVAMFATVHGPQRIASYFYAGLTIVAAFIGSAIAGRQVWLQHLPEDRIPECGPGLEFMLEVYPLAEVIKTALRGTGECASVNWSFLGASIAEWSLLCFVLIVLSHVAFVVYQRKHHRSRLPG